MIHSGVIYLFIVVMYKFCVDELKFGLVDLVYDNLCVWVVIYVG